jgi:DNA gyrase subunit A
LTNRGGKGVKTINVTEKTGKLVSILEVSDSNHLMIINKSGITIRIAVSKLRIMGRATQGVRLIRLNDEDEISSITKIDIADEEITDVVIDDNAVIEDGEEIVAVDGAETEESPETEESAEENEEV